MQDNTILYYTMRAAVLPVLNAIDCLIASHGWLYQRAGTVSRGAILSPRLRPGLADNLRRLRYVNSVLETTDSAFSPFVCLSIRFQSTLEIRDKGHNVCSTNSGSRQAGH